MIQFQKQNILDWQQRAVKNIIIEFVSRGCEWTEASVREVESFPEGYTTHLIDGSNIRYGFETRYKEQLEWAVFTAVKGKWIIKSNHILTRCGCWKSFSFKSWNLSQDKIKLLRKKLRNKPAHTL